MSNYRGRRADELTPPLPTPEPSATVRWAIYIACAFVAGAGIGGVYELLVCLMSMMPKIPVFGFSLPMIYLCSKGVSLVLDWGGRRCQNQSRVAHYTLSLIAGVVSACAAWLVYTNWFQYVAAAPPGGAALPTHEFLWRPDQLFPVIAENYGHAQYKIFGLPVSGPVLGLFWCVETVLLVLLPPFLGGGYIRESIEDHARFECVNFSRPQVRLVVAAEIPAQSSPDAGAASNRPAAVSPPKTDDIRDA